MKKNKTTFIMILFFFVGLLILFYPLISNIYNQKIHSKAIVDYENILKNYDFDKYKNEIEKAQNYNNQLKMLENPLQSFKLIEGYNEILNIGNTGMIGHIKIDKINVKLPIYHGISEKVLNKAVGHIEGTSLPIGGKGTHSVLSAHRGLPSSKLFTDLDKIEIGDIFLINVLDKELTYEVDQILIVEPSNIEEIEIDSNEDYITLITCTPYAINTHRLLVRGKRIENTNKKMYITTEAFKVNNVIVMLLIEIPTILIILIFILFKPIKK